MIKITNFFAIFVILLSINIAQSCFQLWSNHCSTDGDCCGLTTWCDTRGGSWAYGVCKPGGKKVVADLVRKGSKLSDKTCLNLDDVCQTDDDCCGESTYCDGNDIICKNYINKADEDDDLDLDRDADKQKNKKSSSKTCYGLWSNHCRTSMDCCGSTTYCDTNGGSWAYGVCKPGGKRVVQTNEELRSTNTFPSSSTVPTAKSQKL